MPETCGCELFLKVALDHARVLPAGAGETHFVVYGEQVKGPGAGLVRQQT